MACKPTGTGPVEPPKRHASGAGPRHSFAEPHVTCLGPAEVQAAIAPFPAVPPSKQIICGVPSSVKSISCAAPFLEASVTRRKLSLVLLLAASVAGPLWAGTHSAAAFKKLQSLSGD